MRLLLWWTRMRCLRFMSPLIPSSTGPHLLNSQSKKPRNFSSLQAMETSSTDPSRGKRAMYLNCFKPTRTCLCTRLQIEPPGLDNLGRVTVLQHSLEEKLPLNSTRILRLRLRNVTVASVSDVNFGARICIDCSPGFSGEGLDFDDQDAEIRPTQKLGEGLDVERSKLAGIEPIKAVESCGVRDGREQVMDMGMAKKGAVRSIKHVWMSTDCEKKKTDLREVLESRSAGDALAKGFLVRKLEKRQVGLIVGRLDEFEEFRLEVPSGSLQLFPSEEALTVAEIKETDVKVKNLIVLDGAWMKARRMYGENPWLRFLPHLKLDLDTTSLYRQVRSQPKEGYLSTIESVIYAMNALGDYTKGLSKLLTAFEVMVDDQRQC